MEQDCLNSEKTLAEIAGQIRQLEKKSIANVVEIGRLIHESQSVCRHGRWMEWIKAELAWSHQTAWRYTKAYKLSKRFDLTALNLSITALYFIVDLHAKDNKDPAIAEILKLAETSRVTARIAVQIATPSPPPLLPEVEAPPVAPQGTGPKSKAERTRASMFGLCRAIKYPMTDWEEAVQYLSPVKLRTIIDRLELIYQTRVVSRFESDD